MFITLNKVGRKKILFLSAFAVLCGICLFADGLPLGDSNTRSKWLGMLFLVFAWGVLSPFLAHERTIKVRSADIAFVTLFIYVSLRSLPRGNAELGLQLAAILFLYVFFRRAERSYLKGIIFVVGMMTAVLSLWGLGQWLHILPAGKSSFPVVGNFDNPAGLASALAAGIPFIVYFCQAKERTFRFISYFTAAIAVLAIVVSESRAGMLAVGCCLLCAGIKRIGRRGEKTKIALSIGVFIAVAVALYFLKRDSADGRILIWLVTLRLIARSPLFGGGTGAFAAHYMPEQARYFTAHPDSQFAMLADNVNHPFNEYLSILVQWGLVGLLLAGILLYILIMAWQKNQNKDNDTLTMALLSLGIFSFFSYPLSYAFGWVVLTLCLAFLARYADVVAERPFTSPSRMLQASASAVLLALSVWQYHAYTEWYRIIHHRPSVPMIDLQQRYEKLLPAMNRQPLFLYNYAAELYFHEWYPEALEVAEQSRLLRNDYETEHLMADIYKSMKRNEDARKGYQIMSQMCPNRFIPVYRLFEIAVEEKSTILAQHFAKEIIKKPIKVSSPQVEYMKKRCLLFFKEN